MSATMTTPMTIPMTMMPATTLTAITTASVHHQHSSTILYTRYKHRNRVTHCFTVLKSFLKWPIHTITIQTQLLLL